MTDLNPTPENERQEPIVPPADRLPPPVEYGPPPVFDGPPILTPKRALAEILFVFAALGVPLLVRSLIFGLGARRLADLVGIHLYEIVVANGLLVIAAIGIVLYLDRRPWRSLGLHWDDPAGDIAATIVALICIYGLTALVGLVVAYLWPQAYQAVTTQRADVAMMFPKIRPLAIVGFTLFVGLYEELLFRGFLITRLIALVKHPAWAVIISSLAFGALHFYQDPLAMFQIFTIALVLGILFLIRRSLIAPILVHFTFDCVSLMTAMYYIQRMPK